MKCVWLMLRLFLVMVFACGVVMAQQEEMPAPQADSTPSTAARRAVFQISGKVVNSVNGAAVRGAKVTIASATQREKTREVLSSQTGQFAFDNVAAGKYSLVMRAKNFFPQAFEQHENYSSAIAVGPGKKSTGILFRARPDATISGHVTNEFSEPVQEGQVYLFFEGVQEGRRVRHFARTASLNDEGEYRFRHLPAGTFYLAVVARPWYSQFVLHQGGMLVAAAAKDGQPAIDPAVQEAQEKTATLLDVAYPVTYFGNVTDVADTAALVTRPGQTTVADISMTPVRAGHLTIDSPDEATPGTVGVSSGFSLRQEIMDGFEAPLTYNMAGTNPGKMDLQGIPPGHYKLTMQKYREGARPDEATREIDVAGDVNELAVSDIAAKEGATLGGTLILEGGPATPPANGMIYVVSPTTRRGRQAKLGPKGQFKFDEPLSPGRYQVFILDVPYFVPREITAKGARVRGREMTIEKDTTDVRLTITASKGVGVVTGTAASTSGEPMAGAMIVLVPEKGTDSAIAIRRDQSDSDGTFTLAQIVPGRYTVLALRDAWEMEWNNAEVLRKYLPRGTNVVVEEKSKQDVKVEVQ
jgi:uncharacterized surface anchored protein